MHRRIIGIAAGLTALAAAATMAGCTGKSSEQYKDAKRAATNSNAADTLTFPDGFSNAATKCDHGNRVYVLFHNDNPFGGIAVVPADPSCK